jgi:serine/threonine protein kinase
LDEQDRPADSSLEEHRSESAPGRPSNRFEHYELATDKNGKPVELGRGAMGVTYKAFDVDLQCSVTLKVINEKYLGDESARLRFVREARAAASVRHPNVASVLHLGRTGSSYFYAMEFVGGEALEHLIKRLGQLEVRLALEIVSQVAAGLAAVHKQKLIHRDIKPSNIMVNLEDGCAVIVKIIGLGLAGERTKCSKSDFNARRFRWDTRVCQPGTVRRSSGGHPFRSLLPRCDALGDGGRSAAFPRLFSRTDLSASARALTA